MSDLTVIRNAVQTLSGSAVNIAAVWEPVVLSARDVRQEVCERAISNVFFFFNAFLLQVWFSKCRLLPDLVLLSVSYTFLPVLIAQGFFLWCNFNVAGKMYWMV